MLLITYLKDAGETVSQFASRIDEAESTIRKIVYRQRQPSLQLSIKIVAATGGAVSASDLVIAPMRRSWAV